MSLSLSVDEKLITKMRSERERVGFEGAGRRRAAAVWPRPKRRRKDTGGDVSAADEMARLEREGNWRWKWASKGGRRPWKWTMTCRRRRRWPGFWGPCVRRREEAPPTEAKKVMEEVEPWRRKRRIGLVKIQLIWLFIEWGDLIGDTWSSSVLLHGINLPRHTKNVILLG